MNKLLAERLVVRDHLSFFETSRGRRLVLVQLKGHVECASDLVVFVDKRIDIRRGARGRDEARTFAYNYHAMLFGHERDVLRYDNAHGPLHRHAFDLRTGRQMGVDLITIEDLPTLDGVIREAIGLVRASEG